MCSINVHHICKLKGTFNYKNETRGASSLLNDPIRFQFPSRDFSGQVFFSGYKFSFLIYFFNVFVAFFPVLTYGPPCGLVEITT